MRALIFLFLLPVMLSISCASGPRMTVIEGTTIGLNATPGDGSSKPPQVTLAYKRVEMAIVPTDQRPSVTNQSDCLSSITALNFKTQFFGATRIDDFFATGFAARSLAGNSSFQSNLLNTVLTNSPGFR